MIPLPQELMTRLGGEVTTVALCWRLGRRDGVVLGFTTHDVAFTYDGVRYCPAPSFTPSQIMSAAGLSVDTLEVEGVLTSAAISETDLDAGRYDDAVVDIFLIDWERLDLGAVPLRSGRMGNIKRDKGGFNAELRGRKQDLQSPIGGVYSPECRAQLGDKRCRVALRDFTYAAQVTAVFSPQQFQCDVATVDDFLHYGRLRWLSGKNAGLRGEVKSDVEQALTLVEPPPFPIQSGDRLEVEAGCDKRFITCRTKFNNGDNFRGEPHVPGVDSLLNYPGLR